MNLQEPCTCKEHLNEVSGINHNLQVILIKLKFFLAKATIIKTYISHRYKCRAIEDIINSHRMNVELLKKKNSHRNECRAIEEKINNHRNECRAIEDKINNHRNECRAIEDKINSPAHLWRGSR